jgi:hypothetical protein
MQSDALPPTNAAALKKRSMNHLTYHHHPEEKRSEVAKVEEAELVETLAQKLKTNLILPISPQFSRKFIYSHYY